MSDPFHGSKYGIERAKHHISDLERQAIQFLDSNPYGQCIEPDTDTTDQLHKIKLVKPMPFALPGLAFDAVNNLRAALDRAVWAVAKMAGNNPRYISFPFAKDADHIKNAINGRCKGLPEEIRDIRTFKPYKGGNNLLWALNELCNTNKHAIISPVAVASSKLIAATTIARDSLMAIPPRWDRTKNEMILFRVREGGEIQTQFRIALHIAMCDIEFVDGQPADAVLNEFVRIVESIVMAIEAETRRLGLI